MLEWKNSDPERATFQKWVTRIAIAWCVVIVVLAIFVNSGCDGDEVPQEADAGACCLPTACSRVEPACCELPDAAPLCEE